MPEIQAVGIVINTLSILTPMWKMYCSMCGEIKSEIILISLALDNTFLFRGQAWLFRPTVNLSVGISYESED